MPCITRARAAASPRGAVTRLAGMSGTDTKAVLRSYLRQARDAVLWKLEGLSEYEVRRPMVPTGANLLGLIKHLAGLEMGYFGGTFGRRSAVRLPWFDEGSEPNDDMWATAEESRAQIVDLYRRAQAHADVTIDSLALDAVGRVPWWPPERRAVTLDTVLVHMIAETNRHAGHADIVRELIDGSVGVGAGDRSMAPGDGAWWQAYRERLERVAREAAPG